MRNFHNQYRCERLDAKLGYGCDGADEGVLVAYELEIGLQAEDSSIAKD